MDQTFIRSFSALEPLHELVAAFAAAQRMSPEATYELNLAVEEIFTNYVKYNGGTSRDIRVTACRCAGEVRVCLIDYDVDPFDITQVPVPDMDEAARNGAPGGRGVYLVRLMTDRIDYDYDERERISRTTLIKNVEKDHAGN